MAKQMTADDSERAAHERLISALKELGVLSRIDEKGRVLVSDGEQEYEVVVDLGRLLSRMMGSRQIAVGKASLPRLERGDITELFPRGLRVRREAPAAADAPVSPHYAPLEWQTDEDNFDDDDVIAAKSDDWTYWICPVRGDADHVLGYHVSGSDYESGAEFGSSLIDGEPGELTLQGAKMVAETDYADRYREAEGFLDGALGHWDDDNGPRSRRNEHGHIMFRTDEPVDEVEVVATLRDFFNDYDPDASRVTVCLRTILSWNDGYADVLEELRSIVRKGLQGKGSR